MSSPEVGIGLVRRRLYQLKINPSATIFRES